MSKKRVMVIGANKSGKTSLINNLLGIDEEPKRRQDVIYKGNTIDVPAAYIENRWYNRHVISLSQEAYCVLVLASQNDNEVFYSHGFAQSFLCDNIVGVVTKIDINSLGTEKSEAQLKLCGVKPPYFYIDNIKKTGIEELKEYLNGMKKR